jgi:hypothetical protein
VAWTASGATSNRGGDAAPFRGRAYVNFLGREGDNRVRAAYGEKFERLVELKDRYDPDNFFRMNQNVPPSK